MKVIHRLAVSIFPLTLCSLFWAFKNDSGSQPTWDTSRSPQGVPGPHAGHVSSCTPCFSHRRQLRLLLGVSELPASPLLCFGAIMRSNKGDLNTGAVTPQELIRGPRPTRGLAGGSVCSADTRGAGATHAPGGTERDGADLVPSRYSEQLAI